MDEHGRGGGPPMTTLRGDGAPARRRAVPAGRLDDWWDPAWDSAWWDPVWTAHGPADTAQPMAAASQQREAAAAAHGAEPGIPGCLPDASSSDVAGPATAVPAGPAAVPRTSPEALVTPPWGQFLATTIGLRVTRRPPPAGIAASVPGSARQRGSRFRALLRHPPGRRPHPACRPRLARSPWFTARHPGEPARSPWFTARGAGEPARGPWFTARGAGEPTRGPWFTARGPAVPRGCWRSRCWVRGCWPLAPGQLGSSWPAARRPVPCGGLRGRRPSPCRRAGPRRRPGWRPSSKPPGRCG
jgi:hypothetical protein